MHMQLQRAKSRQVINSLAGKLIQVLQREQTIQQREQTIQDKFYIKQINSTNNKQQEKIQPGNKFHKFIRFTVDQKSKYDTILTNYSLLKQVGVNLPKIYCINANNYQIDFQYINHKSKLVYTPNQCQIMIQILTKLHNFDYQNNKYVKQNNILLSKYSFKPHYQRFKPDLLIFNNLFINDQSNASSFQLSQSSQFALSLEQIQILDRQMRQIVQYLQIESQKSQLLTFLHRDLNRGNILVQRTNTLAQKSNVLEQGSDIITDNAQEQKQLLYLIDFDTQAIGLYIVDIVYFLNDKNFYVQEEQFEILKKRYYNEVIKSNIKDIVSYQQFQDHLYKCALFFTYRWLFLMTYFYVVKKVSFQMDLIPLVKAIQRNLRHYNQKILFPQGKFNSIIQLSKITTKVLSAFILKYNQLTPILNLTPLTQQINLKFNQSFIKSKINQIAGQSILINKQAIKMANNKKFNGQDYTAILLAAGFGSRIGYKHKALLQLGQQNKTLIQIWIQKLLELDIKNIVIGQLTERVQKTRQVLKKYANNIKITYMLSQQPLGSGKTVIQCFKLAQTQKVLLISCDIYTNFDMTRLFKQLDFSSDQIQVKDKKNKIKYDGCILYCQQVKKGNYFLNNNKVVRSIKYSQQNIHQNKSKDMPQQINNQLINKQKQQQLKIIPMLYNGLGIFIKEQLLKHQISSKQKYQLSQVFDKYFGQYNLNGIKLNQFKSQNQIQYQFLININSQDQLIEARKLYAKSNDKKN